jgi:hypothetical protein
MAHVLAFGGGLSQQFEEDIFGIGPLDRADDASRPADGHENASLPAQLDYLAPASCI